MALEDYQQEIGLGLDAVANVAQRVNEAKADDGKIDAGEALSILSSALLGVLMGVASIQTSKEPNNHDD